MAEYFAHHVPGRHASHGLSESSGSASSIRTMTPASTQLLLGLPSCHTVLTRATRALSGGIGKSGDDAIDGGAMRVDRAGRMLRAPSPSFLQKAHEAQAQKGQRVSLNLVLHSSRHLRVKSPPIGLHGGDVTGGNTNCVGLLPLPG